MPVAPEALAAAGAGEGVVDALAVGRLPLHGLAGEGTRLLWLGDVVPLDMPLVRGVCSPGDLILMVGIARRA